MKALEFKTKQEAEQVAIELHKLLIKEKGYTSEAYGTPIETINSTWLLFELKGFEKHLSDFKFVEIKKELIKVNEI